MTDRDNARWAGRADGGHKHVRRIKKYVVELKRRIVEETFTPGESVSVVARRHDVNANLVFAWRQKYHRGELGQGTRESRRSHPDFVPVGVVTSGPQVEPPSLPSPSSSVQHASASAAVPATGRRGIMIEISLPGGIKVRVDAGIAKPYLTSSLQK